MATHEQRQARVVPPARADTAGRIPRQATAPADVERRPAGSVAARRALAILRIAIGFVFLWAFVDKLFGLGYSTPATQAWIHGGSPTEGFLSHLDAGPLRGVFSAMAGTWWADWLFMIGLGAIGIAVILGIGLRISAIAGSLLMVGMWLAEWPLARYGYSGTVTGSTNPIVDYHIVYALALIVCAFFGAGRTWGFGESWRQYVGRRRWLR